MILYLFHFCLNFIHGLKCKRRWAVFVLWCIILPSVGGFVNAVNLTLYSFLHSVLTPFNWPTLYWVANNRKLVYQGLKEVDLLAFHNQKPKVRQFKASVWINDALKGTPSSLELCYLQSLVDRDHSPAHTKCPLPSQPLTCALRRMKGERQMEEEHVPL